MWKLSVKVCPVIQAHANYLRNSGDGKARVRDEKQTTVFKRALNVEYHLKLKTSRAILSEINKRYPCMPFPLRKLLEDGSTSKLGLVECLQHGLLQSYPVLWEKDGALVAQVKGTVLLLPNGSDRITCSHAQDVHSEVKVSVRFRCSSVYSAMMSWFPLPHWYFDELSLIRFRLFDPLSLLTPSDTYLSIMTFLCYDRMCEIEQDSLKT